MTGLVSYVGVLSIEMLGTGLMFCALASELTTRFLALFPEARTAPSVPELIAGHRGTFTPDRTVRIAAE